MTAINIFVTACLFRGVNSLTLVSDAALSDSEFSADLRFSILDSLAMTVTNTVKECEVLRNVLNEAEMMYLRALTEYEKA